MFPKPKPALTPNTYAYESEPMVKPTGFREYDARWLLGTEINLMGVQALGIGLGTLIHQLDVKPEIVTGHDFRAYSASVKTALISGLMARAARCTTSASRSRPWPISPSSTSTCVRGDGHRLPQRQWLDRREDGCQSPAHLRSGRDDRLKQIVLEARFDMRGGGSYAFRRELPRPLYRRPHQSPEDQAPPQGGLRLRQRHRRGVRAASARAVGCEVVRLDCDLDHTFPKYNPNTEDMKMLHAMRDEVLRVKADVALGFDGDGDRCGVVDNEGEEIFADKVGVMLARDISARHKGRDFRRDVKSTGLFMTDPVLRNNGATTDYWKTGHSYMKRRVNEIGAVAGFEKSGHFFFNKPLGRGYDDGLIFALAVCDMLDRSPTRAWPNSRTRCPRPGRHRPCPRIAPTRSNTAWSTMW
jgi:phosphomannomutase/phosphoglucomutase